MPTNYPEGVDVFTEPGDPASTPLDSSGTGSRNHHEHHRDLGDAVEALQQHAAKKNHDHSGGEGDPKLSQENTHENVDTNSSPSAIHHTLGTGANQAAPGNHTHDYSGGSILNAPWRICTTTTRPSSPPLGLTIYETDTNTVRVWAKFPKDNSPRWALLPAANIPIVQLRQGKRQQIPAVGAPLEWTVEEEDTFGCFDASTNQREIIIKEPGFYSIAASVCWDPSEVFGDHAMLGLVVNGVLTMRNSAVFIRGNLFNPNFSQTVNLATGYRLKAGDRVSIRAWHNGWRGILTFLDTTTTWDKRDSTLSLHYVCP